MDHGDTREHSGACLPRRDAPTGRRALWIQERKPPHCVYEDHSTGWFESMARAVAFPAGFLRIGPCRRISVIRRHEVAWKLCRRRDGSLCGRDGQGFHGSDGMGFPARYAESHASRAEIRRGRRKRPEGRPELRGCRIGNGSGGLGRNRTCDRNVLPGLRDMTYPGQSYVKSYAEHAAQDAICSW